MSDPITLQLDDIYSKQKRYKEQSKQLRSEGRISLLKKLHAHIQDRQEEIKTAIYQDFGKSPIETDITEIFAASFEIKEIIKNLKKWMKDKPVGKSLLFATVKAYLHYEPKGNSLIITPWNYPFQLPITHLASSIAAGNTAILKLSEFTPHINQVIKQLIADTFSPEHVFVVEGEAEITTHLLNRKFDHIHFTGSPTVGKIIMAAAAKNLTDITLELGGKSPAFIDKNVNIQQVVKNLIWAKFVNAGQTCIAPDYLIVDQQIATQFEQVFKEELTIAFGQNPIESPDYARIINDKQFDRLTESLEDAKAIGAQIIIGGSSDRSTRYMAPTLVKNVSSTNKLMQEEIFGPILPVVYVQQVNEGIKMVNAMEKPLALYIFSKDQNYISHILRNTTSGGTCINDAMIHILHPNLPFGGVNNSGIGQSFGWYGFKAFSHERAVAQVRLMPMSKLFWFPYSNKTLKILSWMKRFVG